MDVCWGDLPKKGDMDESIDVNDALTHASNPDNNIRSIGEDMLKRLQNRDLPNFLLYLSSELVREGIPEESRVHVGISMPCKVLVENRR